MSKSLWDISVELEASKLSIIPSTLDITNRYVTTGNAFGRAIGFAVALRQEKHLRNFFKGVHAKQGEFSFKNGFGRKRNGSR